MSSALRIALIAHNHFPIRQPFAGGIEAHVWHLARALVADGHRVVLFAAAGSDLGCRHPGLSVEVLPRTAAASVPFPAPGAVKESHHRAFVGLVTRLAAGAHGHFDVVHNHSLHHVPILLSPKLPAPVLTTLHTPPFPLLEYAVGATAGAAFAAVSRHAAAEWEPLGSSRMFLVRNGIDVERWPVGGGGEHLVWSGRITREKGPHLAIAAALLTGRRLVLAGPVADADYFSRHVEPRLGDPVEYVGHLDQHELATVVGGAAVALVTPTWDEPYCLVAAEALACGTPVVAFARGGLTEFVDRTCGRLVPPGDVSAMAAVVDEAAALPRSDVRDAAVGRCGVAAMVAGYVSVYRHLIDERRAHRIRTSVDHGGWQHDRDNGH